MIVNMNLPGREALFSADDPLRVHQRTSTEMIPFPEYTDNRTEQITLQINVCVCVRET